MTGTVFEEAADVLQAAGADLGVTAWRPVTQSMIDGFADVTDDHQWIHVDPERAATGPYGATIAHGFLTLSLIPSFLAELYQVRHKRLSLNYGLDRVRFLNPVKVGARVRAAIRIAAAESAGGRIRVVFGVTIEIEGEAKPACAAELIVLLVP